MKKAVSINRERDKNIEEKNKKVSIKQNQRQKNINKILF